MNKKIILHGSERLETLCLHSPPLCVISSIFARDGLQMTPDTMRSVRAHNGRDGK